MFRRSTCNEVMQTIRPNLQCPRWGVGPSYTSEIRAASTLLPYNYYLPKTRSALRGLTSMYHVGSEIHNVNNVRMLVDLSQWVPLQLLVLRLSVPDLQTLTGINVVTDCYIRSIVHNYLDLTVRACCHKP
jgi:hypothetical protein